MSKWNIFDSLIYDFKLIYKERRIWLYLSQQDIKSRFRRSKLGILWLLIQQLAFSLGGGIVWATIFKVNPGEFIPFITVGFAVWGFISGMLVESTSTFIIAHAYLKQLPINQAIFIMRTITTMTFYLLLSLIIAIIISAAFGSLKIIGFLYLIPGILLLYIFGFSMVGLMSYLGIRFRDLPHAISGLMMLLFVVSPVIYPPKLLIERGFGFYANINPVTSIIEIIRVPIIEGTPATLFNYIVVISLTLFTFITYRYLMTSWSRKISYWL